MRKDPSNRPKRIVDVGCGIGGSSRYLARKYGAKCRCITLSLVQAGRANALANAQGLADQVCFKFAGALNQPFPDDQFDLVWSMESGEHMPDKPKSVFLYQAFQLSSGGVSWYFEVAEVPLVATSTEGEGQAIFAHSQQGVPMGYVILIVTAFELFKFELIFFFMVHTLAFCSVVLDSLAVELN
ncbi:hypothetical protein J1N35_022424 [Gossypium stocksii]|uniref:Methyltransferase domain-containing protein n=1 Tax=Gossypium stocksii TaxID=47602 RepID=A0A9D3VGM0_9ROSI|nr:hypothetical protein J1N35_022424 [Gossypium stocksii]